MLVSVSECQCKSAIGTPQEVEWSPVCWSLALVLIYYYSHTLIGLRGWPGGNGWFIISESFSRCGVGQFYLLYFLSKSSLKSWPSKTELGHWTQRFGNCIKKFTLNNDRFNFIFNIITKKNTHRRQKVFNLSVLSV